MLRRLLPIAATAVTLLTGSAVASSADEAWIQLKSHLDRAPSPTERAGIARIELLAQEHLEPLDALLADFLHRFPDDPRRWEARKIRIHLRATQSVEGPSELEQFLADFETLSLSADAPEWFRKESPDWIWAIRHRQIHLMPETEGRMLLEKPAGSNHPRITEKAKNLLTLHDSPLDWKFTALDGRKVDFSQLRGKVVLVNFWATWCAPCVAKIPYLLALDSRYSDDDLAIIAISLDTDRAALESFLREKKIPWPQHFDGGHFSNEFAARYGITGIPRLWIVDREGRVVNDDASIEDVQAHLPSQSRRSEVIAYDQFTSPKDLWMHILQNPKDSAALDAIVARFPDDPLAAEAKIMRIHNAIVAWRFQGTRPEDTPAMKEQALAVLDSPIAARETAGANARQCLFDIALLARDFSDAYAQLDLFEDAHPNSQNAVWMRTALAARLPRSDMKKALELLDAAEKGLPDAPSSPRAELGARIARVREKLQAPPLADFEFHTLDGRALRLLDLRGKVVVIHVWSSEFPKRLIDPLREVWNRHHKDDLQIVSVSFDEDREKAKAFVADAGIEWPVHFDGKGWKNDFATKFGIESIPRVWLIDRKGYLVEENPPGNLADNVAALLTPPSP